MFQTPIRQIPRNVNGECAKEIDLLHGIHVHEKAPEEGQDCSATAAHFWPGKDDGWPDQVLEGFSAKS